jgi:predicted DNA repair protein MutK
MLWVGGQIIVHGLHEFHLTPIPGWIEHAAEAARHAVPGAGGVASWIVNAALSAVFGIIVGAIVAGVLHLLPRKAAKH